MGYPFPSKSIGSSGEQPRFQTLAGDSQARLSALEWSVVALARNDRLSTLRIPSRVRVAMGILFAARHNPMLADPRLEALRRIAVLSWHYGFAVSGTEVDAFITAGFSSDQYELLVTKTVMARSRSISSDRT